MIPLFKDDAAWAAYETILKSWLGTPYRHMQGCKGRGADCTLFFANALIEAGILTQVDYDYYPRDWHIHTHDELVLNGIYANMQKNAKPGLRLIKMLLTTPLLRGDIVCFKLSYTGVTNHAGIMLGNKMFVHACQGAGVSLQEFDERYGDRLSAILRFFKE